MLKSVHFDDWYGGDIEKETFKACYHLKDINIPDRVKSIYREAFYDCVSLESIRISKYTLVHRDAFCNCPAKIIRY